MGSPKVKMKEAKAAQIMDDARNESSVDGGEISIQDHAMDLLPDKPSLDQTKSEDWSGDAVSSCDASGVYSLLGGSPKFKLRDFFWSSKEDKKGLPLIAWKDIIKPKEYGGLGVKDLSIMSSSLNAKRVAQMLSNFSSIFTEVVKVKYDFISLWNHASCAKGTLEEFELQFTRREDNKTADWIAKRAKQLEQSFVWNKDWPPDVIRLMRKKRNILLTSRDTMYEVCADEMLFGYQSFATKDPQVFDQLEEYVIDRFIDPEGEKLLRYMVWSNGSNTESPTTENKQ
ncbi:allene oxide synthase 1, chloroplastic [Canna indica]|uniref:Allene oxide synthase 1, chloroplastic n=1 Tax=Canna indica TaxID=4628 RepID=A0AAQ3QBN7_9LILI|nr:allene oxide synthase 1, chloroplastic [Canna indica]